MKLLLTCVLISCSVALSAQVQTNVPPSLRAHLRVAEPSSMVDLFVRGDVTCLGLITRELKGEVKMRMNGILSIQVPAIAVSELDRSSCLTGMEFSLDRGYVLNDSMRVHNRINAIHWGDAPLQQGFDGTGVVVGIIDSGLDMDHPDFQDANGNTRVIKFWDQRKPVNGTTPMPYGYGQVCDSAAINAGTCTFGEQPGYFGHGTTVTGTATGTAQATGTQLGAAPGADLVIVSSKFNAPNWRSVVADAVEFIFNQADSLGKPAVVNASLGSYLGSHDGKDAAALFIDSLLLAKEGRAMVCAAGNSQGAPAYHLHTDVTTDTSFTWFEYNAASELGYGAVYFELWADTSDFGNVNFAMGADKVSPAYDFRGATGFRTIQSGIGMSVFDTIFSDAGDQLAVVEYWAEQRGGQYHLVVNMEEPDSSDYFFRFMTTGTGAFDVWTADFFGYSKMITAIPTIAQYAPIADYVLPDDEQTMVDSWACSDQVVTVANYYNEVAYTDVNGNPQTVSGTEGDIATSSSSGPTRDGRIKPDIGATGDITITAAPLATLAALIANEPNKVALGGMHIRNGGTSMASPVVTGAIALYFQKCSRATHSEIKSALLNTASADAFTGTVPNTRWGAGKLDAFSALITSNYDVDISVFGDSALCPGDSVLISGPILDSFLWSSGDTTKMFWLSSAGPLYTQATNSSGCIAYSDTINIIQHPGPATPVITLAGNTIISTPAFQYQWYFEGGPLAGETGQQLLAGFTGNYHVLVSDTNGCTAASDSVYYLVVGLGENVESGDINTWPVPARDQVFIEVPEDLGSSEWTIIVTDEKGALVGSRRVLAREQVLSVDVSNLSNGLYHFRIIVGSDQFIAKIHIAR